MLQPFAFRVVAFALILLGCVVLLTCSSRPEILPYQGTTGTEKRAALGQDFAVVTGTPWATEAAAQVLKDGGSACDAAVTALLLLNVTHGEAAAFGGVAPTLFFNGTTQEVKSYIGVGTAPAKASTQYFVDDGHSYIPSLSIDAQLIPAGLDVVTALMKECGTLPLRELAAPAIAVAQNGFAMHKIMHRNLDLAWYERLGMRILMPSTAEVWLRNGWWQPFHLHQKTVFPALAETLQTLVDVETQALKFGKGRLESIGAIREYFYSGPIAEKIADFHESHNGLITIEDLRGYRGGWEPPVTYAFNEYTWFGNGTWSQSIMEPLILNLLQQTPIADIEHNSPEYIHLVTQAIELAMSDRDTYVGDPSFVEVPLARLLSKEFALERRKLMSEEAYQVPVVAGEIAGYGGVRTGATAALNTALGVFPENAKTGVKKESVLEFAVGQDTSQLAVVDKQGSAVVITPSDFPKSPMLPGTGINLGDRMTQFRLNPLHVNALEPGKRPRITPHSVIVFRGGEFYLAFSTPGGDMQAQALVQVFLNMTLFQMSLQQAISAPRFYSINSPSSFSPHESTAAGLRLERDLYASSAERLRQLGYNVIENPKWDKDFGAVGAIIKTADGSLIAAGDPREETAAYAQ
ncbi:MAG: gamma-glutamyltransferase family protein [Halioglobus sp.]